MVESFHRTKTKLFMGFFIISSVALGADIAISESHDRQVAPPPSLQTLKESEAILGVRGWGDPSPEVEAARAAVLAQQAYRSKVDESMPRHAAEALFVILSATAAATTR